MAFSLQPKDVVAVYYPYYQNLVGLDWLHVCIWRTNPKKAVNSKTCWGIRS
jgi:sensor domain CHASE-containing protein